MFEVKRRFLLPPSNYYISRFPSVGNSPKRRIFIKSNEIEGMDYR
jgi:hypothetical protein